MPHSAAQMAYFTKRIYVLSLGGYRNFMIEIFVMIVIYMNIIHIYSTLTTVPRVNIILTFYAIFFLVNVCQKLPRKKYFYTAKYSLIITDTTISSICTLVLLSK